MTNREPDRVSVTPALYGIPTTWTYTVSPPSAIIDAGGTESFIIKATAPRAKLADANATLSLETGDGRSRDIPVSLAPLRASGLSGFFTIGFFGDPLVLSILVLLLLLGVGLAFYSRDVLEQVQRFSGGK